MRKKIRIIILIVIFPLMISFSPSFLNQWKIRKFYYKEFNGVVVSKFIDRKNHSIKKIFIECDRKNSRKYVLTPNSNYDLYDLVEVGDTLIKKRESYDILKFYETVDTITIECRNDYVFFSQREIPVYYNDSIRPPSISIIKEISDLISTFR